MKTKNPFQFISLETLKSTDSPLVVVIDADAVQEFAEDNCGGRLTGEELADLNCAFSDDAMCDFLHNGISNLRPHLRPD